MSKKRPQRRGHFCWCCGRIRANERFSGRGHARHLCRDCARLGTEELAYRQGVRNVDRLLSWDGLIRRGQRRTFERFLHHPSERIRTYAREVAAQDELERAHRRDAWLRQEEEELGMEGELCEEPDAEQAGAGVREGGRFEELDEIPF